MGTNSARADTTAVYRAASQPFEMRIEVASSGTVRGEVKGQAAYFLNVDGQGYLVLETPQGLAVERLSDVAIVLREALDVTLAQHPDLKAAMDQHPTIGLKPQGAVTVRGRVGKAYGFDLGNGAPPSQPVVVVSSDPALAELGKAMAGQFEMSSALNPMAKGEDLSKQMLKILRSGAALTFGGAELDTVDTTKIDTGRFVVPKTPETLDQVRIRFKANGGHLP